MQLFQEPPLHIHTQSYINKINPPGMAKQLSGTCDTFCGNFDIQSALSVSFGFESPLPAMIQHLQSVYLQGVCSGRDVISDRATC